MTEEFSIWNSHVISTSLARDYRGASQNRKFDRGVLFFGSKSFIKCSSYVSNKKIRIWLSNYRTFYFHGPPYYVCVIHNWVTCYASDPGHPAG